MPTPPAALHATLLSERHPVALTPLPAMRPRSLNDTTPAPPPPTTVTLCVPVAATFASTVPLTDTPSRVIAAIKLPTIIAVVLQTVRDVLIADAALATMPLLDTHCVAAGGLPPSRILPEYPESPAPEPSTVTLCDDVVATLVLSTELTTCPFIVSAAVRLPPCVITVMLTRSRSDTDADDRTRNALVDPHTVDCKAELPTRSLLDVAWLATLAPTTVTL